MSLAPLGKTKEILWAIRSHKDPRWNKLGRSTVATIFQRAPEAIKHLESMEKKYGRYPSDLEYEAYKA